MDFARTENSLIVSVAEGSALFSSYKELPKRAIYLIYSTILPFIEYCMFYTDLSYFLTAVQGLPYELMGLLITVIGMSTFVASTPLGVAADKYGRKECSLSAT